MIDVIVRAVKTTDEPELLSLIREEMVALGEQDPRFRPRGDAMDRYATYLRDRMREMDSAVFVAEREGRVVGLAVASMRQQVSFFEPSRFGTISDLVVSKSMRRRGVGSFLLDRMTKWFRGLGIETVRLHVASCNDAARAFWRARGAEDYLVETWIDLAKAPAPRVPQTPETARPAHHGPGYAWTDDLAGGI